MTPPDPRPLSGKRIAFYLRHHEAIDEWAAIREELPEHVHRHCLSLVQPLEGMAEKLGVTLSAIDLDGLNPKLLLNRADWTRGGQLLVGIGIEWRSKSVNLIDDNPYVGLWVNKDAAGGDVLYGALRRKLSSESEAADSLEGWWPTRTFLMPVGEFWKDMTPFTNRLLKRIMADWEALYRLVDHAVDRYPG